MTESDNKRQAKCSAKKRSKGLVPFQCWVTPEQREALKQFVARLVQGLE